VGKQTHKYGFLYFFGETHLLWREKFPHPFFAELLKRGGEKERKPPPQAHAHRRSYVKIPPPKNKNEQLHWNWTGVTGK